MGVKGDKELKERHTSQEPHIITGQRIHPAKLEQARALRRRMTPAEKRLWSALRRHQLDGLHFRRQQVIGGFIVDFYCDKARLVVEVDGPVHDEQKEYDAERDKVLEALEIQVLRCRNEEVLHDLDAILERIRSAVRECRRPPSQCRGGPAQGTL